MESEFPFSLGANCINLQFNNNNEKENMMNNNKRKGYCTKCFYTVYPNEGFVENNRLQHRECTESLRDLTIKRHLNPRVSNMLGQASRKKVVQLLDGMSI